MVFRISLISSKRLSVFLLSSTDSSPSECRPALKSLDTSLNSFNALDILPENVRTNASDNSVVATISPMSCDLSDIPLFPAAGFVPPNNPP